MLDLWLSDVVPGPPDGAPQVVAVTGRMITLTWNPPRSLDMAIGGSGPRRAVGRDGGVDRAGSVRGAKGAKRGGQGPGKHMGSDGSKRSAGGMAGSCLACLLSMAGEALAPGQDPSLLLLEESGACVMILGICSFFLSIISPCSVPQFPHLR